MPCAGITWSEAFSGCDLILGGGRSSRHRPIGQRHPRSGGRASAL
ncbi:hypothetical protein SNL152K_975 [Streptomyces sp. NL15-2K]|nr:hypothetical protein SNL152K_975 [Streptomyces sp. NL15-2K]